MESWNGRDLKGHFSSSSPAMRETLPLEQGHLPGDQESDEDSHNVVELICIPAVSGKSVVFCSSPWKFNPTCCSFLVHFPALEQLFILALPCLYQNAVILSLRQ